MLILVGDLVGDPLVTVGDRVSEDDLLRVLPFLLIRDFFFFLRGGVGAAVTLVGVGVALSL